MCTQIGLLNNGIFLSVFLERTIFASIIFTYADIIISIDKRNWRFNGLKKIQLTMSIMLLYYGRYLHPQFRLLAVRKNMLWCFWIWIDSLLAKSIGILNTVLYFAILFLFWLIRNILKINILNILTDTDTFIISANNYIHETITQ